MKINWKKVALVTVPVLVVATAFVIWYKTTLPKKTYVSNNPATTPPIKPSPSVANPVFPLQQGSNNSTVKQLQTALGVTADGIFGPKTLAALQAQYGKSSIPDQDTLISVINASGSNGDAVRAPAQNLYNQFQAGGMDIYVQNATFADQVNESSSGALTPNGTGFQMTAMQSYDNTVYVLDGVTAQGLLIMKVLSGPLQGEYTVDPSNITLFAHQNVYSSQPVVDPSTGIYAYPQLGL